MGAPVKALSTWVVRDGVYRQVVGLGPWWQHRAGLVEKPTAVYVKQVNAGLGLDRLVQLVDETPPSVAPSSVVAYDAGSSNELGVTWSTSGVHPLWDALVQYYESVPAFDPGDPPVLTLRESETVSAASGGAVSSYQFPIGAQAVVEVRFKMGTGNGPTTTSNTVTF